MSIPRQSQLNYDWLKARLARSISGYATALRWWAMLLASAPIYAQAQAGAVDDGGNLQAYLAEVGRLNATGSVKRISGRCASACTSYLGVNRVCVEDDAEVWFHGAYHPRTGKLDPAGSLQLMAVYPPAIRRWAIRVGALETTEWSVERMLTAPELVRLGIRRCEPARRGSGTSRAQTP